MQFLFVFRPFFRCLPLLFLVLAAACPNAPVKISEDLPRGEAGGPCYTNLTCNSGLICTKGTCSQANAIDAGRQGCRSYADCDDGLQCNGLETCDFTTGECLPGTPKDCNDGNPCNGEEVCDTESDSCIAGTPVECSDGNDCNGIEVCNAQTGECEPGSLRQCDDLNPCNGVETCNEADGTCNPGEAIVCDDGDACNGVETCDVATGGCAPGTPVSCSDGNPCNGTETCNAATGACEAGPAIDCQDGDPCNGQEKCDPNSGACTGGEPVNCDDGDHCNGYEVCVSEMGGCVAGTPLVCDDGNPCNGTETCVNATGACLPGTPIVYDDGTPCNGTETCDPETGEEVVSDPLVCEDDDPCTVNECTENGCISYPSNEPGCCNANEDCDDNDPCNGTETCETTTGVCQTGTPLVCNDGDACTHDNICMPGVGCYFPPTCEDDDRCTIDSCNSETGECAFIPKCDDGILCTLDRCDETTGQCSNELALTNSVICDDGNKCTVDTCDLSTDSCSNTPIQCNARDACEHEGTCNANTGLCEWEPLDCYEELGESPNDLCRRVNCRPVGGQNSPAGCYAEIGVLPPGQPNYGDDNGFCDDMNPCTLDTCDSQVGCSNVLYEEPPLTACDDSNPCTNDGCGVSGECENVLVDVDDQDACTIDQCDLATGDISHEPLPCHDSNTCSLAGCSAGTCTYLYPDRTQGECCEGKFFDYANSLSRLEDISNFTFCHGAGGDTKWQFSDLQSTSRGGALYFGNTETLSLQNSEDPDAAVSGSFITEPILLPEGGNDLVLQFSVLTYMAHPWSFNFHVSLATQLETGAPCASNFEVLWELTANAYSNTQTVSLSDYAGQAVYLKFGFDSAMQDIENSTALVVDDILVTSACGDEPCGNETDCDDGRHCTVDTCVANNCVHAPVVCNDGNLCTDSFCSEDTGACEHPAKTCNALDDFSGRDCYEISCDETTGQCLYDYIDLADDDLCNGTEFCNRNTGLPDTTGPVVCEDSNLCDGIKACNPENGQCENGEPKNCYIELGIEPDDEDDEGSADPDDYACHGKTNCRPSTGECSLSWYHPTPLADDYYCPLSPDACGGGHTPDTPGDAPSDYFKVTDSRGFVLKDRDLWGEFEALIGEIKNMNGVNAVSAATAISNWNRHAVDDSFWLLNRPLCLDEAFSFDNDDFNPSGLAEISAKAGWWPQGVSGTSDAYEEGLFGGNEYMAISSYHKASEGDYSVAPPGSLSTTDSDACPPGLTDPDIDDCSKGARISFFNTNNTNDATYRHMLLVTPTRDANGNPSIKPVISHVGGLVWYKNYLYVPQTGSGFRIFDLNHIMELPTDRDGDFIGRNSDGVISAFNYRYVIPEVGRYYKCKTCCCARFSYVSLYRDDLGVRLVSGEYSDEDGYPARIMEWELDPNTGRLVTEYDSKLVKARRAVFPNLGDLQGAAYDSKRGFYWVASNYSVGRVPSGWLHAGAANLDGISSVYSHSSVVGIEDLYIDTHEDRIWTVGEFPGMRYITGLDLEEITDWHPCGCSLAGYTCVLQNFVEDLIDDVVDTVVDVVDDTIEWVAGWF